MGYIPYEILPRRNSFDDKPFIRSRQALSKILLNRVGKSHKLSKYCLTWLKSIENFNLFR